jgi:hypothetical protein
MRDGPSIRLRETPNAAPFGAQVIDAQFEVVAGKRRGVLGVLWTAVVAIFWAALIGFLIPPAWMFAQRLLGG